MAEFFDHPETGILHFRAMAGGFGGGATSFYEAPAKHADIAAYPQDHTRYLVAKKKAAAQASASETKAAEVAADVAQIEASAEHLAHTQT